MKSFCYCAVATATLAAGVLMLSPKREPEHRLHTVRRDAASATGDTFPGPVTGPAPGDGAGSRLGDAIRAWAATTTTTLPPPPTTTSTAPRAVASPPTTTTTHRSYRSVTRPYSAPSGPVTAPTSGDYASVRQCIKNHESGDYSNHSYGYNGASGAYQVVRSTYVAWAARAGLPNRGAAYLAPPAEQDALVVYMLGHGGAGNWSNRFGNDPCTAGLPGGG